MKNIRRTLLLALGLISLSACENFDGDDVRTLDPPANRDPDVPSLLPQPDPSHKAEKLSRVLGWPADKKPIPPAGFVITEFAGNLDNPRNVYALPNGDILVAESNSTPKGPKEINLVPDKAARKGTSANRITRLRDSDGDGIAEQRTEFIKGRIQGGLRTFQRWETDR